MNATTGWHTSKQFFAMVTIVTVVALAVLCVRLAGPNDLADNAQEQPISYALDIVQNHHWIVQWDENGNVASKPPLLNWLLALCALACGGLSSLAVVIPPALSTLALALLLLVAGFRLFGGRAGFFAALMYLLCGVAAKQVTLVRADGVFAFLVALTTLLALRAWILGRGWTAAWIAAAFATLAKGPLALLLVGFAFLAVPWERRSGASHPVRGSHWKGALAFLAIAGGWFALGLMTAGDALPRKTLLGELFHHAVTSGKHAVPFQQFHQPILYFLGWFGPWSFLAVWGFWRVWSKPADDLHERRIERFLFCWFVPGLLLFCASPHQRADLLWPIIPAAALLAGRELDRMTVDWRWPRISLAATIVLLITLLGLFGYYGVIRAKDHAVVQSIALERLAREVHAGLGDGISVSTVNVSPVFQMHLGVCLPNTDPAMACRLLRGRDPAFVVVNDVDLFKRQCGTNIFVLAEAPRQRLYHTALISNQPRLERTATRVLAYGDLVIRLEGIQFLKKHGDTFVIEPEANARASVAFSNSRRHACNVQVAFSSGSAITSPQEYVITGSNTVMVTQGN